MASKQVATALCRGLVVAALSACGGKVMPQPAPSPEKMAVGYGTLPAASVSGAVSSLSAKQLGRVRVARVEELLVGRVAGLQVSPGPNGGYSLRIRGVTSPSGNNEPLVVIDGIPVSPNGIGGAFAGLSPGDIARVEVLKDAGSTAIYGSRAANGVILISTRRGR